jgi:hypothetical protein
MENKMKIDTISYTEKFNKGNYESVEVGFTAAVEEGENAVDVLYTLKTLAHNFFHHGGKVAEMGPQPAKFEEPKVEQPKPEVSKPKRKSKAVEEKSDSEKKADIVDGQEVPPVIPPAIPQEEMEEVESPFAASKDVVVYDLKNKDHRDRFAAYLTKTYPNWKTKPKEQLLAMSQELSGKAFEDKQGVMLESFKNIVAGFFE